MQLRDVERAAELWERGREVILAQEFGRRRRASGTAAPALADQLLTAGANGPVVLFNVSDIRSDALVLTSDGVHVVPLPGIDRRIVHDKAAETLHWIDHSDDAQLLPLLGWIWDRLTGPVLDALGLRERPAGDAGRWPRVWWCPPALLSFLPLHAAGHHETRQDAVPATVIDRVISSYAPTVRALLYVRRDAAGPHAPVPWPRQILIVAMPHTPGQADLPAAAQETAAVASFEPTGGARILAGPDATRAAVLGGLNEHSWAHFACHAREDPEDPDGGRLYLYDHESDPLTLRDVRELQLPGAELAFLSACSTARPAGRLPDETMHLATAFQLAGYRHVIATLWPIADRAALRIAADFYGTIGDSGAGQAATALHAAARRMRAELPDLPTVWAAHTHSGP